ncbi:MAG: amidohydrolase [Bacteroidetes bacterium]|nr:MAG: amidohydrolase [Bacteroidota bacterium]
MGLKEKIISLSEKYLNEIIAVRRHLHANPELSFQEYNTSKFIAGKLNEWGIPYKDGIVKTGIVATITGAQLPSLGGKDRAGYCLALRADMDALPITETNEVEYKSQNTGVMHACGHDVHTSSLLGAAKILHELKNEFSGTVKLIFQPGEEKAPGGASLMIKEGVLEDPKPSSIIAQHVFPSLEAGKVGFRSGKYMASTDEIYLTVKGKGGHAAMKGTYVNPLLIAAEILISLEKEFGASPLSSGEGQRVRRGGAIPTVLAFGRMHANGTTNIIPNEVKIDGTFRTMDETWRKEAQNIIKEVAVSKAKSMGGDCDVNIMTGYPALVNDEQTTAKAKKYAEDLLGKENVIELELRMTGEDFSFYAQKIPACFYRLGTGNISKGITSGVHTSTFNIDESALQTGMGLMAWIALNELKCI